MPTLARFLYLITALVAWVALAVQFWLLARTITAEGASLGFALWRFLGFFTILTNSAIAIASTILFIAPRSTLLTARSKLSLATAIALVGIVYSIALRSIWNPQGLQAVVDHALHDATPVLFVAAWLADRHGTPRWSDSFWTVAFPAAYCAYAMTRGAFDGWYAYYFLDPSKLPGGQFVLNIAGLLAVVIAIALVLVALKRLAGSWRRGQPPDGQIR